MELNIYRHWDHENNAKLLCKRPRMDHRISEYLFSFINEKILVQKKIMQTGSCNFTLFMKLFDPKKHIRFFENPFDTENTKYAPYFNQSITSKNIKIFCSSTLFTEKMTPREYVDIIYNMFGLYFILRYKKLSKILFDELKHNIDYDYLNSYAFPAVFEDQKYEFDNSVIGINPIYDKTHKKWINETEFNIKSEYIKVFGK